MSTESPNIDLSIVIVNYNVRDLLENCLRSVYAALGGITNEVFVVDNKSGDGSTDMVRERFPQVQLIASEENLGFAKANNLALRHAKGKYLLLLNPDTLVQEDTFRTMIAFCESRPEVGMAGCKIINPDGTLEPACRRSFPSPWVSFGKLSGLSKLFPKSRLFARYNLTYLDENESYELDAISGSFMFLRREVFEQIGGLDEEYFMYGEDLDWCHRTQSAGWKLCYVPDTRIIHYGGISTKRSSINATAIFYHAMEVFSEKNLHVSKFSLALIHLGIKIRLFVARSGIATRALVPLLLDAVIITLMYYLSGLWSGGLDGMFLNTGILAALGSFLAGPALTGTYTSDEYRGLRSVVGIYISAVILLLTYLAFPAIGGHALQLMLTFIGVIIVLPGMRSLRALRKDRRKPTLASGSPTLVVSANDRDADIIEKLKKSTVYAYDFVGAIAPDGVTDGSRAGLPIAGRIDQMNTILREQWITDVIFMPSSLTYRDIMAITEQARGLSIRFRVVSESREFAIGKSHIDHLLAGPADSEKPLSLKPYNCFLKRSMDVAIGLPCLIAFLPFVYFSRSRKQEVCSFTRFVNRLPAVVSGKISLVGYPEGLEAPAEVYIGKAGVTGLAQLRNIGSNNSDEAVSLSIQYVRNHSLFLDVEILVRTLVFCLTRKHSPQPMNNDS